MSCSFFWKVPKEGKIMWTCYFVSFAKIFFKQTKTRILSNGRSSTDDKPTPTNFKALSFSNTPVIRHCMENQAIKLHVDYGVLFCFFFSVRWIKNPHNINYNKCSVGVANEITTIWEYKNEKREKRHHHSRMHNFVWYMRILKKRMREWGMSTRITTRQIHTMQGNKLSAKYITFPSFISM